MMSGDMRVRDVVMIEIAWLSRGVLVFGPTEGKKQYFRNGTREGTRRDQNTGQTRKDTRTIIRTIRGMTTITKTIRGKKTTTKTTRRAKITRYEMLLRQA
jgi:hypothetical protein